MDVELTEAGRNRLQERASYRTRMGFITKYPGRVPLGLFIVGAVLLFLLYWKGHIYLEDSISSGDFVIGLFTYFLGCTTIYLGLTEISEGRENRRQDRALAVQDRRRLKVKEQLEDLYSPLIGIGKKDFIEMPHHKYEEPPPGKYVKVEDHVHKVMVEIRSKYKYLAKDELKGLLDRYYLKKWETITDNTLWFEYIEPIWCKINEDFNSLSREYSDLTKAQA